METILKFFNDTPIEVFIILGLFMGGFIAELDWRYGSFWKEFRPKNK
jgi:hypothetical protein